MTTKFEEEVSVLLGQQHGIHDPGDAYPLIVRLKLILECQWEGCPVTDESQKAKAETMLQLRLAAQ